MRAFLVGICGCLLFTFSGCGGSDPAPETDPSTSTNNQPAATQPANSSPKMAETPVTKVDPDKPETKWIGGIPYDVFYDQPLTIAADATSIVSTNTPGTPENGSMPASNGGANPAMEKPEETPTASAGANAAGPDWAKVIPIAVLVEETKALRTRLNTNLQSVGAYNRAMPEIELDAAILTAMGTIATVHPEEDNIKAKAKFVRDLSYEIYSSVDGTGRTPFNNAKENFEKLVTVLDGGAAPDIESEDVIAHSDVAYTSDMMKRIEIAFGSLKANINTESRMTEDPATVERELRVLAALGTLISTESYESVDEEKYQGYVSEFVGGAMESVEAVKLENFEQFQAGLNRMQVTCAECHQQYKGSDSGF